MTLIIQTNRPGELHVWLIDRGRTIHQRKLVAHHGSEKLLRFIDASISLTGQTTKAIRSIIVVRGPGRFTAVRSGLVVANTLGWLLNVPTRGIVSAELLSPNPSLLAHKKAGTTRPIRPWYGQEPNITWPTVAKAEQKL